MNIMLQDCRVNRNGNEAMKYLQGLIMLALLITSASYRKRMREATIRLSDANNEVEASLRRLDVLDNGGKPKIRMVARGKPIRS